MKKNTKKKTENRGGARPGAGRHLMYGETTKIIRFSVPESKIKIITDLVYAQLNNWKIKNDGL